MAKIFFFPEKIGEKKGLIFIFFQITWRGGEREENKAKQRNTEDFSG